jgi:hypothetical protein
MGVDGNGCPACGYPLDFAPWTGNSPSDEICPCCFIQFGLDDSGNVAHRKTTYHAWRERWIASGMLWMSKSRSKPQNWDPRAQLKAFED